MEMKPLLEHGKDNRGLLCRALESIGEEPHAGRYIVVSKQILRRGKVALFRFVSMPEKHYNEIPLDRQIFYAGRLWLTIIKPTPVTYLGGPLGHGPNLWSKIKFFLT